jgi:hypothetical protein
VTASTVGRLCDGPVTPVGLHEPSTVRVAPRFRQAESLYVVSVAPEQVVLTLQSLHAEHCSIAVSSTT